MNNLNNNGSQAVNRSTTTFCSFVSGMHVVCIDDVFDEAPPGVILLSTAQAPKIHTVYTIDRVTISELGRKVCLTLKEIPEQRVNLLVHGQPMTGVVLFPAKHFRPLQKLKIEDFMPVVEHLTDEVRA